MIDRVVRPAERERGDDEVRRLRIFAGTLLLLEELNRHRVTSIDRLHRATGLPKSTVVRLMKSWILPSFRPRAK